MLLCTISFLICTWPLSAKSTNLLTKKQVISDLNQVEKLLKRLHPNIYAHRKREDIKRRFKLIKSSAKSTMSVWSTAALVQKMLAAVCDEHTKVDFAKLLRADKEITPDLLRLPLITSPEGLFLDNPSIGTWKEKIVSINGVQADKIKQHIIEVTNVDGCIENETVFTQLQSVEATLTTGNFLNSPAKFELKTKSELSESKHPPIYPLKKSEFRLPTFYNFRWPKERSIRAAGFSTSDDPFESHNSITPAAISVSFSNNNEMAFVQVRSFMRGKQQKTITNKLLRVLIKTNPKHVIIDLTENPGGRIDTASHFASYFLKTSHRVAKRMKMRDRRLGRSKNFKWISAERKKGSLRNIRQFRKVKKRNGFYTLKVRRVSYGNPNFNGKITVLVSPLTRSAATMVALILKRKRNAMIVGVTAGGSSKTSCFAPHGAYKLKNSGIYVRIPRICYDRNNQKGKDNGHLIPDIKIPPTATSSGLLIPLIISTAFENIKKSDLR